MSDHLHILFVEDLLTDYELAERELRSAGLEFSSQRVETRQEFIAALQEFHPDLIVSDYLMPEFDGMQALKLVQELQLDIPFIVLTGSMNEETAVKCLKAGASDYVLKEYPQRLPYAVQEALARHRTKKEKEHQEKQLRQNEQALRQAQQVAHLGSWVWHIQENRLEWSDEMHRIFGISKEDFSGKLADVVNQAIHPDDRLAVEQANRKVIEELQHTPLEYRVLRPNGTVRTVWEEAGELKLNEDGSPETLSGIVQDITERKQAEVFLRSTLEKVRELARRLAEVQESDRKQLASELHDTIGQELTALNIQIQVARDMLLHGQADQAGERLEEASRIVDSATQHVRDIMVDLRPPLLDDYGLLAALRWQGEQFARRYGIDVVVSGDEVQLEPDEAISLFRIVQEALNNIAKHAQASHVEIALEKSDQRLRLTISDDGIGLPTYPEAMIDLKRGWGLRIMSERTEAIGGKLTIESAPGKGCCIIVEMDKQP